MIPLVIFSHYCFLLYTSCLPLAYFSLQFARLGLIIIRLFSSIESFPVDRYKSLHLAFHSFVPISSYNLVDVDTQLAQILLGQVNLLHQLLVRLGNVVEGQNAPAQTEEERGAEGDESPEWKLGSFRVSDFFLFFWPSSFF